MGVWLNSWWSGLPQKVRCVRSVFTAFIYTEKECWNHVLSLSTVTVSHWCKRFLLVIKDLFESSKEAASNVFFPLNSLITLFSLVQVSLWRTWSQSPLAWLCPSGRPSTAAGSSRVLIGQRRSVCWSGDRIWPNKPTRWPWLRAKLWVWNDTLSQTGV